MGTGKTTIGRLLAEKIGYQFIDTDALIEEQIGQTIAELFATQGEELFRQLETDVVRKLAKESGLVIATGGGLVLNPENVALLKQTGTIFCLTASPEDILKRISQQHHIRPLIQEDNPLKKIKELLEQRDPIYRQFKQIGTNTASPQQLTEQIIDVIATPHHHTSHLDIRPNKD